MQNTLKGLAGAALCLALASPPFVLHTGVFHCCPVGAGLWHAANLA